ncbi:MAG: aldo/keto reductase [Candidatus Latescibacterota bacterium]|nr:MAG: aldo/keto reductase [Candidatus Latescibacterota bacterium]
MVSRLGIASGYGVPAASIEKAFHEYRLNYFFVSFIKRGQAKIALSNLLPRFRDKMVIVLPYASFLKHFFLRRTVEGWLRRLNIDNVDAVILQDVKTKSPRLFDVALKLKEEGKVRFIGLSSHERPFIGRIARGAIDLPVDLFHIRYNVVHRGAEEDIFPHLPDVDRPGIVIFTATCWGKPLKANNMPSGEVPLTAPDCYRFVLSNPNVDVCIAGPSTARHMDENLTTLDGGPLSDEEMTRVKRIGDHIHRK